jgi:hypothetical protein
MADAFTAYLAALQQGRPAAAAAGAASAAAARAGGDPLGFLFARLASTRAHSCPPTLSFAVVRRNSLPVRIRYGGIRRNDNAALSRLARHAEGLAAGAAAAGLYAVDGAAAFEVFIRTGGNVPMYAAVAEALAALWPRGAGWTLLEVGPGDGGNLLPALRARETGGGPGPGALDLVEPSPDLLAPLQAAVAALPAGSACRAHAGTLQAFAAASSAAPRRWDVCQSTFALHNLSPAERRPCLRWLRARCRRLALVEFDVPPSLARRGGGVVAPPSAGQARRLLEAYGRGAAEYMGLGARGLQVVDGFLVPILIGYFEPQGVASRGRRRHYIPPRPALIYIENEPNGST